MVKKRWKKKGKAAPNIQEDVDPITRSIAISESFVAVGAGRRWRVLDIRSGCLVADNSSHEAPVRGLAFSPDGHYLVTCGDDKSARVWRTSDWQCVQHLKSGKKATGCTFSADGQHIFLADRFGDVLVGLAVSAAAGQSATAPAPVEGKLLLGHLQSIVTSLTCCSSNTGRQLLVSTDKDGKVRASVLPRDPTKGSYEIQSYSLGHTKFVTSAATVPVPAEVHSASSPGQPHQHHVLSASGDGTIRLWDVDTGKMLGCFVASEQPPSVAFQQQQQEAGLAPADPEQEQQAMAGDDSSDGDSDSGSEQPEQQKAAAAEAVAAEGEDDAQQTEDTAQRQALELEPEQSSDVGTGKHPATYQKLREACSAVLSVAVSADGSKVAAAVEGQQEVQLLSLDAAAGQMQLLQKLSFADVANPAAVAFDNIGRLWVVGGVLARDTESLHLGVAAEGQEPGVWEVVTTAVLQDSTRAALELRVQDEEDQQQQQAGYYFEGFRKAVYVYQEGAQNKRPRRDVRDIERLRVLAAAQDRQQAAEHDAAEQAA